MTYIYLAASVVEASPPLLLRLVHETLRLIHETFSLVAESFGHVGVALFGFVTKPLRVVAKALGFGAAVAKHAWIINSLLINDKYLLKQTIFYKRTQH